MQWWMYVLIAAGLIVVFDVMLVLWLGLVTREPNDHSRHLPSNRER